MEKLENSSEQFAAGFVCPACGERYENMTELADHMLGSHPDYLTSLSNEYKKAVGKHGDDGVTTKVTSAMVTVDPGTPDGFELIGYETVVANIEGYYESRKPDEPMAGLSGPASIANVWIYKRKTGRELMGMSIPMFALAGSAVVLVAGWVLRKTKLWK